MRVAAIVVSHGHAAKLETCLPALRPQVDELVVIANVAELGARRRRAVPTTTAPLGFAANLNRAIADDAGTRCSR